MLSDQDGHGRLFANGTRVVLKSLGLRELDERYFRRAYVTVLVTILPITLYLVVGLLKLAGGIEAAHISDRHHADAVLEPPRAAGTAAPVVAYVHCDGRMVYGMAKDDALPSVFARVSKRRRTPWIAAIMAARRNASHSRRPRPSARMSTRQAACMDLAQEDPWPRCS